MDLPGFRLHPLKGDLAGFWSVTVPGNWRVISALKVATAATWIWSTTIWRNAPCR